MVEREKVDYRGLDGREEVWVAVADHGEPALLPKRSPEW